MHTTEELLTRAYIESLGFYTCFVPTGLKDSGPELKRLNAQNKRENLGATDLKFGFQLFSADLQKLESVSILLPPWASSTWEASALKNSKRLAATIKKGVKTLKLEGLEKADGQRILMAVPAWPTAEGDRAQSLDLIEKLGLDGVITFRSMLNKLAMSADAPISDGNPALGTLKILKAFQLLADPQRDFFS